ncbi:MAG: hypothetical protein ACU0CA_11730 [Paracoccaceae bacterium]
MALNNAEQAESELERLRIELAILRAAKVRDDLTRLLNNGPMDHLKINEIGRIHSKLHNLETDTRALMHRSPLTQNADNTNMPTPEPYLLLNPLPNQSPFSIERIAEKLRNA